MEFVFGRVYSVDLPDGRRRLTRPFSCRVDDQEYVIPVGFEWDGASLPRFAWSLHGHPFDPVHLIPGLWHDAAHAGLFAWLGVTRRYADGVYRRWVRANGLCLVKSWVEWAVVMIFGKSHWRGGPGNENKKGKKESKTMKRLIVVTAAVCVGVALAMFAGCRSVSVRNYGSEVVRNADGDALVDTNGVVQTVSKGWSVDHFQHMMITKADSIEATIKPDDIEFRMSGLDTNPDSEGIANIVEKSLTGAAELSAKVGAAIATAGGSAGAEAIAAYVRKFVAGGGDPAKATVTVSDGKVTCTDGSCTVVGSCADGLCSE